MKKVVFAVLFLLLGFAVSAHANGTYGTCCTSGSQKVCCLTNVLIAGCPGFSSWPNQNDCALCCPIPSAGDNQTICADDNVSLSGNVDPLVYDSVKWTTNGDGSFVDDTALNTTYTPSPNDISFGSVTLTLTVTASVQEGICGASGLAGDGGTPCPPKSDSLKVTINQLPHCTITLDPDAADGSVLAGTEHTASVPSAGTGATYQWVIQDENGNSLITADNGNSVTWTAPQHPGKVYINVKVTDGKGCSCTYDPEIGEKGKGIPVLVQINVRALSGWGTAIFALLLTGLAVAILRRRKAA